MTGRLIRTFLICCSLFLLLVGGCGKKAVDYEHTSASMKPEGYGLETAPAAADEQSGFAAADLEGLDKTGVNPLAEDTTSAEYRATYGRSTAPLLPVYFDFDSSAIRADQQENLNASASYLLADESMRVQVEGNCDERGTVDYNLALGELRAINVKKYLVNLGIAENRITTISYGSQRPLYHGSDEESWAANRRADLVVP